MSPSSTMTRRKSAIKPSVHGQYGILKVRTDAVTGRIKKTGLTSQTPIERDILAQGFTRLAGVDEAGRGPLAGPIVAAAVILTQPITGLDDSKRLTSEQRDALFDELHSGPHCIGCAMLDSNIIDQIGIQSANYAAMAQAVEKLDPPPDFLLVDGYEIRGCPLPQRRVVRGDRQIACIAAASIIAKVTRDRLLLDLDRQYPQYGFSRHKGYGTKEHLDALQQFGPCPIHRKSFMPIAATAETGMLFGCE